MTHQPFMLSVALTPTLPTSTFTHFYEHFWLSTHQKRKFKQVFLFYHTKNESHSLTSLENILN